jgi:hypothetical protein
LLYTINTFEVANKLNKQLPNCRQDFPEPVCESLP